MVLECSVQSITVVAETGHDVFEIVELSIERGGVDFDIGMGLIETLDAFRGRNHTDHDDAVGILFFDEMDGIRCGAASGEHRVETEGYFSSHVWEIFVIFGGDCGVVVALKSDVANGDIGKNF